MMNRVLFFCFAAAAEEEEEEDSRPEIQILTEFPLDT